MSDKIIRENVSAMKPKNFTLVLNEKGGEWLKTVHTSPEQKQRSAKSAALLNITKPYSPKK